DARELRGGMADFAGVQAHANELVAKRKRCLESLEGRVLREMPQKTKDERGADAQLGLGVVASAMQAADDGAHGHVALGVGLRIEKDFCVHHVVGGGTLEVGPGHVVKIL